jgi:hypothetical protein
VRHSLAVAAACAMLVASCSVSFAGGGLRVGAGAGYGFSSMEDGDWVLDEMESFWREIDEGNDDINFESISKDEFSNDLLFFGSAEYELNDRWSVGVEVRTLSSSAKLAGDLEPGDGQDGLIEIADEPESSATAVSVFGVHRLPLGSSPFRLRLGGGVGYLFGAKTKWVEQQVWRESDARAENTIDIEIEASGSGLILQAFAGVEYPIGESLFLVGDLGYRHASVDKLEVDRAVDIVDGVEDDLSSPVEGDGFRWSRDAGFSATEDGRNVGIDFSGFEVTLGLYYGFSF